MKETIRLREESERHWEENQKKWEENQKHLGEFYRQSRELSRLCHTSSMAIDARWGYQSEETFRNFLKAFLEQDFGVRVERYLASDPHGKVFGRPATIELDLVVYNSETLLAEIKSSRSEADVHTFLNKIAFYEEKKPSRLMIISPIVHPKAQKLAQEYGVEVYSYPPSESFS